jgi:hypothetical protein
MMTNKAKKMKAENLKSQNLKNIDRSLTLGIEGNGLFPSSQQTVLKGCHHISDLSPKAWRMAYVAALFIEDRPWINAIEKYQMIIQGSFTNSRDKARDLAAKERLQEQVSIDTYKDRKAFFEAWRNAPCCADDCDRHCDKCSNKEIQFKPVPNFKLDADIRRYITKYGQYQTKSELEEASNARDKSTDIIFSGVRNRKSDNDSVRIREQKGAGLSCEPEEITSDQAERVEAMFLYSGGQELVT